MIRRSIHNALGMMLLVTITLLVIVAGTVLSVGSLVVVADVSHAADPVIGEPDSGFRLKPCPYEDAGFRHRRCVWDARHMGNGSGRSFVRQPAADRQGRIRFVTHHRAHCLLKGNC